MVVAIEAGQPGKKDKEDKEKDTTEAAAAASDQQQQQQQPEPEPESPQPMTVSGTYAWSLLSVFFCNSLMRPAHRFFFQILVLCKFVYLQSQHAGHI